MRSICLLLVPLAVSVSAQETDRNAAHKEIYFLTTVPASSPSLSGLLDQVKLQVSFKYLLNRRGNKGSTGFYSQGMWISYTMKADWALGGHSSPFDEIIHNPEIWWEFVDSNKKEPVLRVGIEHESNGEAGAGSRSWNKLFVQRIDDDIGEEGPLLDATWTRRLDVKLWWAFQVSSRNRDIASYIGVIDRGWLRLGYDALVELNESDDPGDDPYGYRIAIRTRGFPLPSASSRAPGFLQIDANSRLDDVFLHGQYVRGYGEFMHHYNRFEPQKLLIGGMLKPSL